MVKDETEDLESVAKGLKVLGNPSISKALVTNNHWPLGTAPFDDATLYLYLYTINAMFIMQGDIIYLRHYDSLLV